MKVSIVRNTPIKILLEDYYFSYLDVVVKIPAGYAFDGLSIPRPLQWIVDMNKTENIVSGLEHDMLYSAIAPDFVTRQEADAHLYHKIKVVNPVWRAIIVYIGVYYIGFTAYKKDLNYKKYKTQIENERKKLNLSSITKGIHQNTHK